MASRKDVALEAGVSPASVSYYVNKSGYVSASAGEKIQAAIEKLHYSPNQIARSLKIKDSKQFVFLCNEIRNPFYSQLVYHASQAAYKEGYGILFSNVIDDETYLRKLCSYQVSGLFAPNHFISQDLIESIAKQGIPVVVLRDFSWNTLSSEISQVHIVPETIFSEVIQHLNKNDYHKLHFISSASATDREKKDEKLEAFLLASGLDRKQNISYDISTAEQSAEHIQKHWNNFSEKPDAFVCTNDAVAQGVIFSLHQQGVRVPEDVAVVGYDNTKQSQFYIPTISSVDFGADQLGEQIIQMLLDKIQGKPVEDFHITPHLIIRESSTRNDNR